ncbi:hypothetical protein [Dethiosulfovibrio peptidovorans]|uniref:hypothetical protein n=1 Tax=Dethiosulfovibrio peptidovorans TaxID=47055 RepID=UPI0018DD218D|nr:hypothetical protein [Dethiosulfovibrio peptidovorans]
MATIFLVSVGFCSNRDNCIAIVYTEADFQGTSWEIYVTGEYDLWWKIDKDVENPRMIFDLPNDTIASIRVRPGYEVILFEHAELAGDSLVLDIDAPSLEGRWTGQASSLTVFRIEDQELVGRWQASVKSDSTEFAKGGIMDRDEIVAFMEENREGFSELIEAGENQWYDDTTDEQRINVAAYMLGLFEALGYDVSSWTPNTFAQSINNFYDWRKDLSLWQTACLVLNVDGAMYEEIFSSSRCRSLG